jgi:hydroxymethylbilane synthase
MKILRIGTRESQLAVWQATLVQSLLKETGIDSELVFIKSEGDIDTVTPLYALGVQGVFTKTLDAALLNNRVDIAVHSMKDVPTQLAKGIRQASVLKRASHKDIFVYKDPADLEKLGFVNGQWSIGNEQLAIDKEQTTLPNTFTIGTSSIRRIAQWLHRYPGHRIENLRGNVNTRLRKVAESNWNGAVFAAAGVERIELRPQNSVDLDWMLPAPAQGAIMVVCREDDQFSFEACQAFNDEATALCAKIERDFLRTLMGGCSTPISALASNSDGSVIFKGNIISPDGKQKVEVEKKCSASDAGTLGILAANELLGQPSAAKIVQDIRNAKK